MTWLVKVLLQRRLSFLHEMIEMNEMIQMNEMNETKVSISSLAATYLKWWTF